MRCRVLHILHVVKDYVSCVFELRRQLFRMSRVVEGWIEHLCQRLVMYLIGYEIMERVQRIGETFESANTRSSRS